MLKKKKSLIILILVLVIALLFSFYLLVFRRGERTEAALTELQMVDLPAKVVKEAGQTTTITAYDGGSVMTDYNGTIHFTSTDPSASLPVDYTFTLGDQGIKTFSNEILFGSTGTYQIKVEDVLAGISDTQAGIVVFDGHANGSLVKTAAAPEVYFIQDGMKSWVLTPTVLESRFKWNQIIAISQTEMDNYLAHTSEPNLHYREGALFRRYDLGEVYVVENKEKRHIDSPSTLIDKGYNWANVILAESQNVLDAHTTGSDLTGVSALPNGTLVKTSSAPEVYMLESGSRRHIPSPAVLSSQFRSQDIVNIATEAMNLYPIASDYLFRMGTIIKDYDTGNIYFVEGEKKRHFTSTK